MHKHLTILVASQHLLRNDCMFCDDIRGNYENMAPGLDGNDELPILNTK
jgi:hypothetical protein